MEPSTFCFISCVNNEEEYKVALQYIGALYVPDGCTVEYIKICDAKSLTSGYNRAMAQSKAKYKVYLHQDAYILNRNFILEVMNLFQKYPNVGMLGVVGAKTLPDGYLIYSPQLYGQMFHSLKGKGKIEFSSVLDVTGDYESVWAIDGVLMITQYDVDWREDLFTGWHFYDASQSLEFIKKGYEVGVVKQDWPWCFHDTGQISWDGYEENRKIFIQHYAAYITPT